MDNTKQPQKEKYYEDVEDICINRKKKSQKDVNMIINIEGDINKKPPKEKSNNTINNIENSRKLTKDSKETSKEVSIDSIIDSQNTKKPSKETSLSDVKIISPKKVKSPSTTNNTSNPNSSDRELSCDNIFNLKNDNHIIKVLDVDIRTIYHFDNVVGEGVYGKVRKAHRVDNPSKFFAIKSLSKSKIKNMGQLEKELDIISTLDHPNIINFFEYYEDKQYFHIITEICSGLDLFDKFKDTEIEESKIITVFSQIVYAIYYSHNQGIIHRDLKLENIIFENTSEEAQIKIIDWGLSAKFENETNRLKTQTGTPQYIAPEVFKGCYDSQCDIWSIGVMAYEMIVWKFPYNGKTVEEYQLSLKNDVVNYDYSAFKKVSSKCIDFIKGCLQKNPIKRLTIKQCFEHPWFDEIKLFSLKNQKLDKNMLLRLRKYKPPKSKLQQFIEQNFINLLYEQEDLKALRNQFQQMDVNGQPGILTCEDLKTAYAKVNITLDDKEIHEIISRADKTQTGVLDYSEFLIASIYSSKIINKDNLTKIFSYFDEDSTGFIDVMNLKSVMLRTMRKDIMPKDEEYSMIIKEVVNEQHKNVITLNDFLQFFGIDTD